MAATAAIWAAAALVLAVLLALAVTAAVGLLLWLAIGLPEPRRRAPRRPGPVTLAQA